MEYLFVRTRFFVQLENFSPIWRRHNYRWKARNFGLCSALMAIEQWGFFSVPLILWYGASVYNGHLWGTHDTHTYCRVISSGTVTMCFYDLGLSRVRFEYPTFHLRGQRCKPLRHRWCPSWLPLMVTKEMMQWLLKNKRESICFYISWHFWRRKAEEIVHHIRILILLSFGLKLMKINGNDIVRSTIFLWN